MLTVHHLQRSQSERIVFLCEELGLTYELKTYPRDPTTAMAPDVFKQLSPVGTAPTIVDTTFSKAKAAPATQPGAPADAAALPADAVVIAESGAAIDWINHMHGGGRLAVKPGEPEYADYVFWLHWTNATMQADGSKLMMLTLTVGPEAAKEHRFVAMASDRVARDVDMLEEQLGKHLYIAGDRLTAADCMLFYNLTTSKGFTGLDLTGRKNVLAYLKRVGERPAYKRAMQKGDPELEPMLGAEAPGFVFGGVKFGKQ